MASPAASSYRRTSLRSLSTVIVLMVPLLTMTKIIPLARAANDAKYSSEVKLLDYFRDFDVHVPPVDSASDLKNLLINITIKPNEIFGLTVDEHQDLWIDLLLCLYWNSSAFTWLPSDFGNITYISWKKNHIWTPQFTSGTHLFLGADDMKPSRGKMLVMIRWDGLTEWCPQVRLVLSCKEQANGFDSFPADQLKCVSDISSIDTIHSGQYANIHNFTYSKHDFRRMGDLFGNSGYRLQYMRTETTSKQNRIVVGIRRSASQWLYQITLPIILMALLCIVNLWLDAAPHEDHDSRRLTTTFALIILSMLMVCIAFLIILVYLLVVLMNLIIWPL